MTNLRIIFLSGLGVVAGGMIALQSVLSSSLGQRVGNLGSIFLLTLINSVILAVLIIIFPGASTFQNAPGASEWYLYAAGILGIAILAITIFLVPKFGTTSTLVSIILGQLLLALIIDNYGILASPKIPINLIRVLGIVLVIIGAFFVGK